MFFVHLKDFKQRTANASEVANRLSGKTQHIPGVQLFLMAAQDIHIGGRSANATYQYSLQADDLETLRIWTPKVKAALEQIPLLTSVDSDAETGGQEVMIAVDRDRATRLGVNVQMLDEMLNNAFSQRQIATMYQTLNQYHVVMSVNDRWTRDPAVLSQMFVINDRGERIPISAFASFSGANARWRSTTRASQPPVRWPLTCRMAFRWSRRRRR